MKDQATVLRSMVLDSQRLPAFSAGGPAPPMIAIMGGRPGAGATTLTANLAAALAVQGHRIVAIDADPSEPRLAQYLGVTAERGIHMLYAGQHGIHELLKRGPSGVQILPGSPRPAGEIIHYPSVLRQFISLGRHADMVLVDLGSDSRRGLIELWREYSEVVLVTTPDPQSLLDSYAALKANLPTTRKLLVGLAVNRALSPSLAEEICQRLDRSARNYLEVGIRSYGGIPIDPAASIASAAGAPLVLRRPTHPASQAIQRIAAELASRWLESAQQAPAAA
jgi:flagellar biosynthesis protein FlhG